MIVKLSKRIGRSFFYSGCIILPLLMPIMFILFSDVKKTENADQQIHVARDAIAEDFTRFYPRKIFHVGLFLNNIYSINLGEGYFRGDFTCWAKNFFDRSRNDRSIVDENFLKIRNESRIIEKETTIRRISATANDAAADRYVAYCSYAIKGEFSQDFYLANYPFDSHDLKIIVEPKNTTAEDMILGIDPNSSVSPDIDLGAWNITSFSGTSELAEQRSDFSDPVLINKGAVWNIIPRVTFAVTVTRNYLPNLLKQMLPLLVLLMLSYTNFFVQPVEFEAKSGMAITSFLAAAAIHWSSSNDVNVGYLTALDEFFLYSYALFLSVGIEAVVSRVLETHPSHPWFTYGMPILRILFPVFLAVSWYSILLQHIG